MDRRRHRVSDARRCCRAAPPRAAPPLGPDTLIVAAEAWHTDLCLPAAALRAGPLAQVAAAAFAVGFGLEAWLRAARPGSAEAPGALVGGPAAIAVRALNGSVPPGVEEEVLLRLPPGGHAAIAAFIAGQVEGPLPVPPPSGAWALARSRLPYSLSFTCNTWVMRALAEAGLPLPVAGIRLRGAAMAALRAEAVRQAGSSPAGVARAMSRGCHHEALHLQRLAGSTHCVAEPPSEDHA